LRALESSATITYARIFALFAEVSILCSESSRRKPASCTWHAKHLSTVLWVHGTQVHGTQSMAQTYRVCRILLLSQKCLLLGLKLQLDA
jgi:hypothetical protein